MSCHPETCNSPYEGWPLGIVHVNNTASWRVEGLTASPANQPSLYGWSNHTTLVFYVDRSNRCQGTVANAEHGRPTADTKAAATRQKARIRGHAESACGRWILFPIPPRKLTVVLALARGGASPCSRFALRVAPVPAFGRPCLPLRATMRMGHRDGEHRVRLRRVRFGLRPASNREQQKEALLQRLGRGGGSLIAGFRQRPW